MEFPISSCRNPSIQYEMLTEDDTQEVVSFCAKHLFHRLPLLVHLQLKMGPDDYVGFTRYIQSILKKGASYKAVDVNQENGKFIGFALTYIVTVKTNGDQDDGSVDLEEVPNASTFNAVVRYMIGLMDTFDICKAFPVDSYLVHELYLVSPDYGGKGICTEMLDLAENRAKIQNNAQLFVVETTSRFSRRAFSKAGYEIVGKLDFDAICNSAAAAHGKESQIEDDTFGCLQVKYLSC